MVLLTGCVQCISAFSAWAQGAEERIPEARVGIETAKYLLGLAFNLANMMAAALAGQYLVAVFNGKGPAYTVVISVLGTSLIYLASRSLQNT